MIAQSQLEAGAGARSLVGLFETMARRRGAAACAKVKRAGAWQEVSWDELARKARLVADGLASLGVKKGDRVAVIGDTSLDWIAADLGIQGAGAIVVPIYQSNK